MTNSLLLTPQLPHAKQLLDSIYLNGFAVDFSDMGTGKTYCAGAIAKELNCPVVVVCPKVVFPTWKKVFKMFGVEGALIINYELICRGNTKWLTYDKTLYNNKKVWDSSGINVHFPKNSLVIFDEVHRCRGKSSLNGDFLIACKNGGYKVLALSATAATTPIEMRAFGFLANLHSGYNFTKFCSMSGAEFNRFGGMVIDMTSTKAQQGMLAIHNHLFHLQKAASRMTVDMFGGIFPDNHVIAESFDMGINTEKINRVYAQMQSELDRLDERAGNYSEHVFAIMIEARRRAELLKVPMLVETVGDLVDSGLSPVIFLNFKESLDSLEVRLINKFKGLVSKIVGGQKDSEREHDIDSFNNDSKRIMLANLAAGSTGVSLHDLNGKFPRHSLIIPSFSAYNLMQALGRIFRAGTKTKCVQKIVFSSDTIEEHACQRVQCRLDNLSALNDNDLTCGINICGVL